MPPRYRLEFLVKAASWEDVVRIFKSELDISNDKRDASDRDMKGTFLVHVDIESDKLDRSFYQTIMQSELVALSYDPSNKKIRDDILDHVSIVEHNLRKLLLNISDVVEDYFKYFDKTLAKDFSNSGTLVKAGYTDPITSYLTLDEAINILSLDLSSWSNRKLSADDLLELVQECETIDDIKDVLKKRLATNTIWDQIDKYILKKGTNWEDLRADLDKLKKIRNKAAHFRVVTQSDLIDIKKLAKTITTRTQKSAAPTTTDLVGLQKIISEQLKPSLAYSKIISQQLQLTSSSYQKAIVDSMKPTAPLQEILKLLRGPLPPNEEKDTT